eukprot:COSAG05_NODE_2641_length_2811_cov_2.720133_4_plen_147_part_00
MGYLGHITKRELQFTHAIGNRCGYLGSIPLARVSSRPLSLYKVVFVSLSLSLSLSLSSVPHNISRRRRQTLISPDTRGSPSNLQRNSFSRVLGSERILVIFHARAVRLGLHGIPSSGGVLGCNPAPPPQNVRNKTTRALSPSMTTT